MKKRIRNMDYTWLIFALLSAVTAALVAIFGKVGLQDIDANAATTIRAVIMAAFLIGVILLQGKVSQIPSIVSNSRALSFIVLSGVAGALSWLFYFLALKLADASKVAPIDRLSIVFIVVLATLFLGEKLTLNMIVGIVLVAVGAILIVL